ncbi:MAG: DUF1801 domain-containing protein [Pirellulaceae bacterium]
MPQKFESVEQYLASLSVERQEMVGAIRHVILQNLPKGYEEGIQYNMIGYYVPHSVYPAGYHCDPRQPVPFVNLASQKNYVSLYLFCIYVNEELVEWFRDAWTSMGKKLDMGKSCIRIKKPDDVPLKLIGQTVKKVPVKKFLASYEESLKNSRSRKSK